MTDTPLSPWGDGWNLEPAHLNKKNPTLEEQATYYQSQLAALKAAEEEFKESRRTAEIMAKAAKQALDHVKLMERRADEFQKWRLEHYTRISKVSAFNRLKYFLSDVPDYFYEIDLRFLRKDIDFGKTKEECLQDKNFAFEILLESAEVDYYSQLVYAETLARSDGAPPDANLKYEMASQRYDIIKSTLDTLKIQNDKILYAIWDETPIPPISNW
jgi:hypothetical protein